MTVINAIMTDMPPNPVHIKALLPTLSMNRPYTWTQAEILLKKKATEMIYDVPPCQKLPVPFQVTHFHVCFYGTYTGYGDKNFWCSYAQSDITDLVLWNSRFQKYIEREHGDLWVRRVKDHNIFTRYPVSTKIWLFCNH